MNNLFVAVALKGDSYDKVETWEKRIIIENERKAYEELGWLVRDLTEEEYKYHNAIMG